MSWQHQQKNCLTIFLTTTTQFEMKILEEKMLISFFRISKNLQSGDLRLGKSWICNEKVWNEIGNRKSSLTFTFTQKAEASLPQKLIGAKNYNAEFLNTKTTMTKEETRGLSVKTDGSRSRGRGFKSRLQHCKGHLKEPFICIKTC